jgi:hypothetical protein
MKEFYSTHGITMNASTAYHPQTDGQTEQVNQELEQYLQIFCNFDQNYQERMTEVQDQAFTSLNHAAEHMKSWYNKKRKVGPEYKIRNKVMIISKDLKTTRLTQKLADQNYGPFVVQEVIRHSAYKLAIPSSWVNIHNVFNKSVLK